MSKREFNNIIGGPTAPSVMEESSGVKRGAWTHEEDELLRNCIEKYGEGRWHLIPQRAGLKRCRKSCRLRWLNYLKPNIKRGSFEADEVDLIIRMHKLLGNRWALISGRIPGRTANDVKNYWNTNLRKKQAQVARLGRVPQSSEQRIITRSNIIKPRSRSFSKATSNPLDGKAPVSNLEDHSVGKIRAAEEAAEAEAAGDENMWWESLLSIDADVADVQNSMIGWESGSDIVPISSYVFGGQNAVGDNIPLDVSHGWNS